VVVKPEHAQAQLAYLGQTVSTTGYGFPSQGFGPDSLAANASGYVVIADTTQGRIYELTPDGHEIVVGSTPEALETTPLRSIMRATFTPAPQGWFTK